MKKIMNFAAALAVVLPVSCNKEMTMPQGDTLVGKNVKVTMNATIDDPATKLLLDNNLFKWEAGDQVNLRWANVYYDETLTASYDEAEGRLVFEGTFVNGIPMSDASHAQNLYAYYAKDATYTGTNSISFVKDLPAVQTGKLEDLGDYVVYAAMIAKGGIDVTLDSNNVPTEIAFNADMRPYFSLLKINVPAELGLTSIVLSADSDLVGPLCINSSRIVDAEKSKSFGTGTDKLVNMAEEGRSQTITISRGGEIISGDVYFVITPDEYNTEAKAYGNSAESLTFTFVSGENEYSHSSVLTEKLLMGQVKGTMNVPADINNPMVDAGNICLKDETDFTVTIDTPNAECTYYYEIAATAEDCKTPTTESAVLDPEVGFVPSLTGAYNEYYIKVLADYTGTGAYRDRILKAQMRYWKFNKDCPTASVYADAATNLANNGDQVETTDGMLVRRRSTAELTYASNAGSIEFNNCVVPFMPVKNESSVSVYMRTSDVYNNAAKKTINLFYMKSKSASSVSRENAYNEVPTYTQIDRPAGDNPTASNVSVVWSLGNVAEGYCFAFAPDSKTTYYAQGILEVL